MFFPINNQVSNLLCSQGVVELSLPTLTSQIKKNQRNINFFITSVYLSLLKTAAFSLVYGMHIETDLLKKGRKKAQEVSINTEIQVDKKEILTFLYTLIH